jgi:hypothetical protein
MASNGDIVLVYQDENPAFFARIEDIWADHKPGWFQVKFLVLQIPVVEVVWILREAYIHGDTFTMNGRTMRLELVRGTAQAPPERVDRQEGMQKRRPSHNKVISLFDRKKE